VPEDPEFTGPTEDLQPRTHTDQREATDTSALLDRLEEEARCGPIVGRDQSAVREHRRQLVGEDPTDHLHRTGRLEGDG
jgi:hypothetical protein